jgi:serine/threonine protein kinase
MHSIFQISNTNSNILFDCVFTCGCQNELDFLGKIRHPNVISVLGYCIHEDTRLVIYELMQNGSLETQLHGTFHFILILNFHLHYA